MWDVPEIVAGWARYSLDAMAWICCILGKNISVRIWAAFTRGGKSA